MDRIMRQLELMVSILRNECEYNYGCDTVNLYNQKDPPAEECYIQENLGKLYDCLNLLFEIKV